MQRQAAERRRDTGARSGSLLLEDGQSAGRRQGSPHWVCRAADCHHAGGPARSRGSAIALLWFRAVNGLFLHWAEGTLLYVDSGLRYYPDDAVLHLYRGTVHQMYANGRVQQSLNRTDPAAGYAPGPFADPRLREGAAVELARAETALRRALELDPRSPRRASAWRTSLGDLGHPDEAVALVKEALRGSLPPFFESYAHVDPRPQPGARRQPRGGPRRVRSCRDPGADRAGAAHRPLAGRAGGGPPGGRPERRSPTSSGRIAPLRRMPKSGPSTTASTIPLPPFSSRRCGRKSHETPAAYAQGSWRCSSRPPSGQLRAGAQQPVFSARVDTVRVDVDVRRNEQLVPGLGAGDFEVLDNGVPQKVDLIAPSAAPIDVVIVLDTSQSLDAKERAHLTAAGATVIDALRTGERAALVTFVGSHRHPEPVLVGPPGAEGARRRADADGRHGLERRRACGHAGRHGGDRAPDRGPLQRRRGHRELPRRWRGAGDGAAHGSRSSAPSRWATRGGVLPTSPTSQAVSS